MTSLANFSRGGRTDEAGPGWRTITVDEDLAGGYGDAGRRPTETGTTLILEGPRDDEGLPCDGPKVTACRRPRGCDSMLQTRIAWNAVPDLRV
jgi:hypothetical protein